MDELGSVNQEGTIKRSTELVNDRFSYLNLSPITKEYFDKHYKETGLPYKSVEAIFMPSGLDTNVDQVFRSFELAILELHKKEEREFPTVVTRRSPTDTVGESETVIGTTHASVPYTDEGGQHTGHLIVLMKHNQADDLQFRRARTLLFENVNGILTLFGKTPLPAYSEEGRSQI